MPAPIKMRSWVRSRTKILAVQAAMAQDTYNDAIYRVSRVSRIPGTRFHFLPYYEIEYTKIAEKMKWGRRVK